MRILVTRPKEDAVRTAAKLTALGHEAIVDPIFRIEPIEFVWPSALFSAVAVTSANAVRILGADERFQNFKSSPLYVVGAQTAEVARQAGFGNVFVADGDVASLAALLEARLPAGAKVLYFGGENRAQDIGKLAAPAGIKVSTIVVYRAKPVDRFSDQTCKLFRRNEMDGVLHYSPRGSKTFVSLARNEKLDAAISTPWHFCLSEAAARPLIAEGAKVKFAPRPDEEALIGLLKG